MIHIPTDAAYWVAIAHLSNWSREKINDFFDRLHKNRFTFHDFFCLKSEEWESLFHFSQEDIHTLRSIKEKMSFSISVTKKVYERGFEVIPVHSKSYSSHLREKLGKSHAPTIVYAKGNIGLLNIPSVSIFGSNQGVGSGLIFTQNLVRQLVQEKRVIVTSYEPGYNRYVLNLCLQFQGHSLVLLDNGVLSLKRPLDLFEPYIAQGQILFLSTIFPQNSKGKKWSFNRDLLLYGLARDIYITDAVEKRQIWRWVLRGLKQNKPFYVRIPEKNEKSANHLFIVNGAIPVDLNGKILDREKRES